MLEIRGFRGYVKFLAWYLLNIIMRISLRNKRIMNIGGEKIDIVLFLFRDDNRFKIQIIS